MVWQMLKDVRDWLISFHIFLRDANICQVLDVDFEEAEVEKVLLHLPNGKSPNWDGVTNEVFKKYASMLKSPFPQMFQQCWDSGFMPQS